MTRIFFFGFLFLSILSTYAQLPVANFTVPAQVCTDEVFEILNQSANAVRYEWDFCQGDLKQTPSAIDLGNLSTNGANTTVGIDFVQHQGNWFGFFCSINSNSILRLDFGNSLNNSPSITNLGTLNETIKGPQAIRILKEGNNFYGFVSGRYGNRLTRLSFGSTPTSIPVAEALLTGNAPNNTGLDVAFDGINWVVVLTNDFNLTLVRLGSLLSNIPTAADIADTPNITDAMSLGDISLMESEGLWYGFIVSINNGKLIRADFGPQLFNSTPVVTEITNGGIPVGQNPCSVSIFLENNTYQVFVINVQGNLIRYDLGNVIHNNLPVSTDLSNLGVLNSTIKMRVVRDKSKYIGFASNWNNNAVYRFNFPQICTSNIDFTDKKDTTLTYSSSGQKAVTLFSYSEDGKVSAKTKVVAVRPETAPSAAFTSAGICAEHNTQFTAIDQTLSYHWDFGDNQNSIDVNPVHAYDAAGNYPVTLVVEESNGCKNRVVKDIIIYNYPVADFVVPAPSITCSNHQYVFDNTTVYDVEYDPSWSWEIDNIIQSENKVASLSFASVGDHAVKLTASIPGCESTVVKNFNVQLAGPNVNFEMTGRCEDTPVQFTNTTTGPVNNFSWDFGDGQTSADNNPSYIYSNAGDFTVTLTASNAAGCNNTRSKPLTIFSKPQVNFTALAPPFSCSGTPTQFNDLTPPPTDSNLSTWSWNFGDTGSPSNTSAQRNPQHTYATATEYMVTLTVATNFSCSATLQKAVTIYPTPDAAFTHSPLCEDGIVTFSDAASTNQAWNWQVGSSFYFTESVEHIFNNPGNYDVIFSVTGVNNCVGSTTQPVVVPNKLNVDFSTLRSCVNQETEFTDLTNDSSDPITEVSWNFGGLGTAAITPATFTFPEAGTVNVTLTITTESGCAYPLTKPIGITQGPLAAFTATPNTGEAPLTVLFTNTSLNANTFNWKFNSAGSASTVPSPTFIYADEGNFTVELVATDLNNCVDTTHQLIEVFSATELNLPSPNPSSGAFTFEWKTNEATQTAIVLVDALGRQIRSFEVMADAGVNRYILDITGEQPGLYILNIRYLNTVKTYRLMVSE